MGIAIKVEDIVKRYGNITAVNKLSFSVVRGEIFALLGSAGAGKTTALECIEGIRSINEGKITVNGKLGVQLQSASLPGAITALEAFKLFCRWNNTKEDMVLFNYFSLNEFKNKQYKTLSADQKRRLHHAIALINSPDIIILDEPTAGLDAKGCAFLHNEIRRLKESGKTVILASHDMAEVESLCDRIAILKEGKLVFLGTSSELAEEFYGESRIFIRTKNPISLCNLTDSKPYKVETSEQNCITVITADISDALLEILPMLKEMDNDVIDIRVEHAPLEQHLLDIVPC